MTDPRLAHLRLALASGGVCVLLLFAAWPGLLGSWVGDDFHMLRSSRYGDWSEVYRVFSRHAGHYLGESVNPALAAPYRPVTMFTLLLTHVLVPEPWFHHLVSWLMHSATGGLLFYALLCHTRPTRHPESRAVSLVLAALFLLHPVTVETYVWINGRSDLVAGLCLAALAAVLSQSRLPRGTRLVLLGMIAFLGAASKVTFIPASVSLWLGLSLRSEQRRKAFGTGVPLGAGIVVFLCLRAANATLSGRLGASENITRDLSLFADLPQLLARSLVAVATFRAEAMQSLAWQLFQPFSVAEWMGLFTLMAIIGALVIRRDLGGAVLVAGFALTIAPCVIVSRSLWLGFDRYLYMPLILACLASAPHVVAGVKATPRGRPLWTFVAVALVALSVLGTRTASLTYVDQMSFEVAIVHEHPDDPTLVYYMARNARKNDDFDQARMWLSRIQAPPWPDAIVSRTVELADDLSEERVYDMAVEYGLRSFPEDSVVRGHGMRWKYGRGELADALALARTFSDEDGCPEVRRQLDLWLREVDASDQRAQIRETAESLACVHP